MAKKRRPRNRIEVDTWDPGRGFARKWRVYLRLGRYVFGGEEVSDKRAAQRRVAALQAGRQRHLPVEWSE